MKVPQGVVRDLLPAYFAGEASEDTRLLVEECFRQDPEFERSARLAAQQLAPLGEISSLPADLAQEKSALDRIHGILRRQRRLFGLALTFTLNAILVAMSFQISFDDNHQITQVHWFQFGFQLKLTLVLAAVAAILWTIYFIRARRLRAK